MFFFLPKWSHDTYISHHHDVIKLIVVFTIYVCHFCDSEKVGRVQGLSYVLFIFICISRLPVSKWKSKSLPS